MISSRVLSLSIVCILFFLTLPISAYAQSEGLYISVPFTEIVVPKGEVIVIPVSIGNNLDRPLQASLSLISPPNWTYSFLFDGYQVKKVYLNPDETKKLTLRLEPKEVEIGPHVFILKAISDVMVSNQISIVIELVEPKREVSLKTRYPSLKGPSGSTFDFNFDIVNDGDKDLIFTFSALEVPNGWDVVFKPAYGEEIISSVLVRAKSTAYGLVARVNSPKIASPGLYRIIISVTSEGFEDRLEFTVELTGLHRLFFETKEGLLSYKVTAGETQTIVLVIRNEGTADLRDIEISSYKPTGWIVNLLPSKIDVLPAGSRAEVLAVMQPPGDVIAGDYSVDISVYSRETGIDTIKLRITVTKPTLWGVIGIVIVIASIFGLMYAFRRYGRP